MAAGAAAWFVVHRSVRGPDVEPAALRRRRRYRARLAGERRRQDDGARRSVLHVERRRFDADSRGMMRIDAHQHFWRYSADDYGWIDDSMATLRRDFLP